ncbi:Universal stress protein [Parasponia andersonii]|uniref:Universal stress protein n=1 Tax=Parasponia andersonii TaxID=3476 RepID=A0A2P5E497_PARAD|nr:Universal stress protein [Parasponia andersonii]
MASTDIKPVMVMGLYDSKHSFYALEWTLERYFANFGPNCPFKLVIVLARPTPASVVGVGGPGSGAFMTVIESEFKRKATRAVDEIKEICRKKSVEDVKVEIVEGNPRKVICDAVDRHHASILVVGSHGYGAVKRAVLGSVSDYCAHHAHCSVTIVKRPSKTSIDMSYFR